MFSYFSKKFDEKKNSKRNSITINQNKNIPYAPVPSEYSLKADLPPLAPREVPYGYSNQKSNYNPPIILLNGNGMTRTGTMPRKVYNNFDDGISTFNRNDKKKRASFSLPSSPKVSQNNGVKRLDNWIGSLIKSVPIFSRGRKTPDPLSCERIYDTKISSDNLSKGISRTVRFDEGVSKDPNQLPPSVTIHSNINPQLTPHQPTNVAPSNYINPTLQNVNQSKVNPNQQPPWNYVNGYETDKNTSSKNNYNNIPDSHNQHYSNMGSLPRNYSSSSRNSQNMTTPHHRANKLLQQLRSDDDCDYSENDEKLDAIQQANKISHQNYGKSHIGSGIHSSGVIFVQYNDETKRALLPPKLNSIEQLKNIFLKAFPYLSGQYLNLSYVKIYIQDSTDKSQVFYELDDLRDVKDRCILKIREQISGYQSPPPIRFTDKVPGTFDYMSEGEGDDYNSVYGRNSNYARLGIQSNYRPASAIPGTDGRMYSAQVVRRDSGVGKNTSSKFDPYYDPYFSDTSSTGVPQSPCVVPRSANATPTVDREARFRMETMEKQLQGLSSLVHSALVTKNIDNFGQKDISDLRKQILEFNNNSTDNCDILSTTGSIDIRNLDSCNTSICSSITGNDNLIGDIRKLKKQIISYTTDIKQLKKQAQDLKKCNNDGLRDMKDRINVLLNNYVSNIKNNDIKIIEIEKNANDDPETENLRKDHISQMAYLHTNLSTFERNVENLRKTVVDGNKKLKMIEVENLTNTLTTLGRTAAQLKTDFPTLYGKIENKIKNDMECVIRNETFIKEEQNHIDNCLKRCKTLANMMVTMKKLAMVQDPAISNYTNKIQQNYNNSALFNPSKPPVPKLNVPSNTNNISDNKNYEREQSIESDKGKDDDDITIMAEPLPQNSHQQGVVNKGIPPPVPPSPKNYYAPPLGGEEKPPVSKKFSSNTHVLDSILDELSSNEMEPEEKSDIKLHLNGKEAPKYSLKNEKAKSPYENISSSYNNLNEQQPPSYSSLSNKFPNLSNNLTVTPPYTTHRNDKYLPTNNSSDSPSSSSYSPSISNSSVTCNSSDSSSLFSHNYNPSEYSLKEKQKQLDCQFEQLQKLVPMLK